MLTQEQIEDAVNRLYEAERNHIQIPALTIAATSPNAQALKRRPSGEPSVSDASNRNLQLSQRAAPRAEK